jgi:sRNA-binding carbon storage regulator CsrA
VQEDGGDHAAGIRDEGTGITQEDDGMLVLQRSAGQGVVIEHRGERMRVTVERLLSDGRIRLGFEAGKNFTIHRDEIQVVVDECGPRPDDSGRPS